ncbi:hypothetical protein BGZ97_008568 [Linnemannia gamsii]|uniref:Uncharacterized protein n=1 Tax=Linnemannia gamsii TaxID=64522 RepID=A0A9P6QR19_9FUNG|nr:hypothetical protein BGZ97_008568 [Linnemannia gamsii]
MFASLVGLLHQPSIALRVPGDDTTFNPKEYPNVTVIAQGKVQGKIRIIHNIHDDSGLGLISTRIWVTKDNDKEEVAIRTRFEDRTITFTLEGPRRFANLNIYHETTISIPSSVRTMENLIIDIPNSSLSGDGLQNLIWNKVKSDLSNSSIALETLHADTIDLRTSNSSISGSYEAGHIDLNTSNGSISAKLVVHEARDGRQSSVTTKTSNSGLELHVNATPTSKGLWMDNSTRNGKAIVGCLLGPASRGSYVSVTSANSKVELSLDASQTGQPLEVHTKTSNASIVTSIMVPQDQPFKGLAQSSNSSVTVNLTEAFQGRFDLATSNSSAVVEGTHLQLDTDKKSNKRGSRGQGSSDVKLSTSNASLNLRFYPAGDSLAADTKYGY